MARVFRPLLEPARYKAAYGGRWSGKSYNFAEMLIDDSLRWPGENGGQGLSSLCVRETMIDLDFSSKKLIEERLNKLGLDESTGFKVYNRLIKTPGDGVIMFKGMQDYKSESFKSLAGFLRGWVEEAATMSQKSLADLTPSFRGSQAEMWFSWNPSRPTDAVDRMFRGAETPSDSIVVRANWDNNPFYKDDPGAEIERLNCLRMQPDDYAHIWEGEYRNIASNGYYSKLITQAKKEGRICFARPDPLMSIRAYWDIGGTGENADATAIWICQFIGAEVRVLDYYEVCGQPLSCHVDWLRANGYKNALMVLPHDGRTHDKVNKVTFESFLKEAGFDVKLVKNMGVGAALRRIEATRRVFPSIVFNEETTIHGIEALASYREKRDEKRNVGLGPIHDWASHAASAFGMMCCDKLENGAVNRKPPVRVEFSENYL